MAGSEVALRIGDAFDVTITPTLVQSTKINKRTTDYQNAEKQILDDSSYVFINHGVSVQATTTKVHNFLLLPTTIMLFSQVWLA